MAEELCWELFKSTGKINYYMLYKAIKGQKIGRNISNSDSVK